ncbi:hypothetical protein Ndes2526B_g00541 [Nannochloris sp. 'desiccata']|nr:hypothetical protein KSW81_003853 [Chlorella desiccata (nom. nud.)]KAH7624350.1 hypothetical protein NADE_003703 [Chlorella desiccata (nom. nud.)]
METHAYQPAATDTFPTIPNSYINDNYVTHIFGNVNSTPGNNLVISAHPNGIAFITLASSHAAFNISATSSQPPATDAKEDITSVDACLSFDVGYQQAGEASGKSLLHAKFIKGRGPLISPDQPICKLELSRTQVTVSSIPHISEAASLVDSSENSEFFLISLPVVKGGLVEINQSIINSKGKALLQVLKDEYIAIIELRPSELDTLRAAAAAATSH